MTTTTSAASAVNGAQMRDLLDRAETQRTWMDRIKAAPAALRSWLVQAAKTLHLDSAAAAVGSGASWLWSKVQQVLGFGATAVRRLGAVNIAGAALTTPEVRRNLVSLAARAWGVVKTPFRWISGGLKWALGKVGLTSAVSALEAGEARGALAEAWVAGKVAAGLAWCDRQQGTSLVQAIQGMSYAGLAAGLLRWAFPAVHSGVTTGLSIAAGLVQGYRTWKAARSEDKAIARAKVVLTKTPARDETGQFMAAPKHAHSMRPVVWILTDASKSGDDRTTELPGFIDEHGTRWVRFDSDSLEREADMGEGYTIVGEVTAKSVGSVVREAQADPTGTPPSLPRAARRASNRARARK